MILVIQNKLLHYRLDFLNALAKLDDVVVVHSGKSMRRIGDQFEEVVVSSKRFGPFYKQRGLLELIEVRQPNAVIAMFDVRWINTIRAMYRFDKRLTWVWWGLDRGNSALATFAKLLIARRPNPIVFYTDYARKEFSKALGREDGLFVANNTFHVAKRFESYRNPVKNRIINVGSLDARKQNDVTIRVLKRIREDTDADIRFSLIGEGAELESLSALASEVGVREQVDFLGHIEDPKELAGYYAEAIASVSFGQAGLAVLQSMAFGVPFVTKRNAISGGEIHNIANGRTGLIVDDDPAALEVALRSLFGNVERARAMGEAAYRYYSEEATLEKMVDCFQNAISYRTKKK